MKPLKPILIWLLLPMLIHSVFSPVIADDSEKWCKDLEKDYRRVLEAKKKQVERHRGLVEEWHGKGHLADLILSYETDSELESADAALHYGLGYAYAIQGRGGTKQNARFEKAANQFKVAISLDPNMLLAHFSLGGVYQQQDRLSAALREVEICLQLNPKYYPAHYKMGKIYLQQGSFDEALKSFADTIALNNKWGYPHYGIGLVYLEQGNDDAAREAFEAAINRNKKFAPAHFKLGQILAKVGFFDEALEKYQEGARYQAYTAEVLCELGEIFAREDNQADAVDLYQHALAIEPAYPPVLLQLGNIYYATDQPELAIEHYRQAIEADATLKGYFIEQLAPYHAGMMGTDEAKSWLDRSLAVTPDDPQAHFYYAKIEADAGNVAAAIQHYEKTIALIESDESYLEMELPLGNFLDAYLALGDLYYQQENNAEAVATYRRAIELDAALEWHFFDLGKTAFDAEQFELAIEPLNKFLLIYTEHVEATYLLGRSYEVSTDVDNALRLYARTVELSPNHEDALLRSARLYRAQGDSQNALARLIKLIEIDPENVEAHYLSGLSHLELVQPEGALAAFLETTCLEPDHVDGHYRVALLYEQKGDFDNAIDRYETTLELDRSKADPFLRVGAIYLQRGDRDNVVRVYEPGLEIEPDHPQTQYDLAGIFEERKDNEKAIKHFRLANQYDDGHFDWHFRYARLLDRHARTAVNYDRYAVMAVEEYGKTMAQKHDYAPAYFYRALIARRYKQIGEVLYRYSQIAEDFKQAVSLEPGNVDAHYHLGMTYIDLDRRDRAKETFRETLRLNPKYNSANLQIGLIAEWEQKYKEAIQHYEAEVAIDPKSVKAYQQLGSLYNTYVVDFGRAKAAFDKALKFAPNHVPTLLNYGNTLFNLDQLGAATEQFERALQLVPTDFTANYNVALMYEYTGKTRQAIDRWKKFLRLNPPAEWKAEAEQHLRQLQP